MIAGARSLQAGRGLLKDDAYERIKHLIQTQVFKPGTFLSERELAARLGMSKTPVRSALERLQSEGFVQISPQQGAVVREPSLNEISRGTRDDRDRACHLLEAPRDDSPWDDEDIHARTHQLGGQVENTLDLITVGAALDDEVLPVDPTKLSHPVVQ